MGLRDTPRGDRFHIGIFGSCNSGKSSLLNMLTGQHISLVSSEAGTTADPVYKAMEASGLGPCLFIDTAGFGEAGTLGQQRQERSRQAIVESDAAILLFASGSELEYSWLAALRQAAVPVLAVVAKADTYGDGGHSLAESIREHGHIQPILTSTRKNKGRDELLDSLVRLLPADAGAGSLTGSLAAEGDSVMLVMPQDRQAPKGRLILPQVQVLRDLLDKSCSVFCVTADKLGESLQRLAAPPQLIITDSQVFRQVYAVKPLESRLTSFSLLFAAAKGDIGYFLSSAQKLDELSPKANILIAEACTHKPLREDIGREKLPRLLRKRLGEDIHLDIVSGPDFPQELRGYDFIIHCGACMFNRRYVMSRVQAAKAAGIPMSNYGVMLAQLAGILPFVAVPD